MYSTLIVLDQPRHLRFTFGVISDFEQAIPGGFINIFKYDAVGDTGFRVCRDILYAGLKWEDPTLTLSCMVNIMTNIGALYSSDELVSLWKKIFVALEHDQWTSRNTEEKEQVTIPELINEVEKIAYGILNLQPDQLYALTPRELNLMLERHGESENYRTGMICATIMNSVGGKKSGGAFEVSDFVNIKRTPKRMSDDDIRETLVNAFGGR